MSLQPSSQANSTANLQLQAQQWAQYMALDPVFPYTVIPVPFDALNLGVDMPTLAVTTTPAA